MSALLLLSLAGCWPYIPGHWSDYGGDTGDTDQANHDTRIVGRVLYGEYVGGYWDTTAKPGGLVAFGYYDEPQPDVDPIGWWADTRDGCTHNYDLATMSDAFADLDSTATFTGANGDIDLDWDTDYHLFYGSIAKADWKNTSTYDLADLDADGTTVSVSEVASGLPALTFDGLALDGDTPDTIAAKQLAITWADAGDADSVMIIATLYDDTLANALEIVTCVAPASAGELKIPATEWKQLASGGGWGVEIATLKEFDRPVQGASGTSKVLAGHEVIGFVYKE